MIQKKIYSLAYSSCPNDTFIFKALATSLMDIDSMKFNIHLDDVENLNQDALKYRFDITKLSFAALGKVLNNYALLRTGAALGNGCGPLLVSRYKDYKKKTYKTIAVPGLNTTAFYLFSFYRQEQFSDYEFKILPMPFDKIMPAVQKGQADAGVIIHEGRFVYQQMGLEKIEDLGQWWEDKTRLPIPLGCIAIRRSLGCDMALKMENLIRKSIHHGFSNPELEMDYIRRHAQELDDKVINQHISLYVNDYSLDLGHKGEEAIKTFFNHAVRAGLMDQCPSKLFAE